MMFHKFQHGNRNRKILIWGEAGVGKTTFCSKLCQDWALVVTRRELSELDRLTEEQRRKMARIGILVYIVLRDTKADQTLEQILTSQYGFNSSLADFVMDVANHEYITLLIDGFDEISYSEGEIINLLRGKLCTNMNFIITCRLHASRGLVLNVDWEIRLKGFSESQAKAFVEVYALNKYGDTKEARSFVLDTWKQIEASDDLREMSTNPSMLQLLCLLSAQIGKIGKDKAKVFKLYSQYLLTNYHMKVTGDLKGAANVQDLYKDEVLKIGQLALKGLEQNHLQLVFSKQLALQIASNVVFDMGFLTELPSNDAESQKVQFVHKSLQEYLAAYYVVNSNHEKGMQLLLEFCSTSQRLMGSHMILSFVSAMSKAMGKVIQTQIEKYVSMWASEDEVDPKSRTSFLMAMLKDNQSLTFPLPETVDIDLREYDSISGRITKQIKRFLGKKTTLDRFLSMDAGGVKKIKASLGVYTRLNILLNVKTSGLKELAVDYHNTWYNKDDIHLSKFMESANVVSLSISNCKYDLLGSSRFVTNMNTLNTIVLRHCNFSRESSLTSLNGVQLLNTIEIHGCGILVDEEVAKAVAKLPCIKEVDISENILAKEGCSFLLHKAKNLTYLGLRNSKIMIDAKIAEILKELPENTQIDLSGNTMARMESRLLLSVLRFTPQQEELDITNWRLTLDVKFIKAISRLSSLSTLLIAWNTLTPEAASELSKTVPHFTKLEILGLRHTNFPGDLLKQMASNLSQNCPFLEELYLSSIKVTSHHWALHIHITKLTWLSLNSCGINAFIFTAILESLSKYCPLLDYLGVSNNNLASLEWKEDLKRLTKLSLANCRFSNDEMVTLFCSLARHCPSMEKLDLRCNQLSSGVWQVVEHSKGMKRFRRLALWGNPCMEDEEDQELCASFKKAIPQLELHQAFSITGFFS